MPRLLDRDSELERLGASWEATLQGDPQLVVVWGRRRVGKTFLLSHFASRKRAVFFGATEQAEGVELARLAETVARDLGRERIDLAGGSFGSWEQALRFFAALAKQEPLLVVLDEVPYLTRSTRGFGSIVQVVWDHLQAGTKLMLVLTGSAISTMTSLLGAGGPLRGRPTMTLRLDPVDVVSARRFLPALRGADLIEAFAACGGYPLHLLDWDQQASTASNLLRLAASPGGVLLEDASGMLREELGDAAGYARILAAIGRGRTRHSEIASDAGQRIEHPLQVLLDSGFIRKAVPVGAPAAARGLYEIDDPYLAFWFSVLYSDNTAIAAGQGRNVLKRRQPLWQRHVGAVFEEVARAHARRLVERGVLPDDLVIGRWWATSGTPVEVDVLGLRGSRTALLGEVRWQRGPLTTVDLERLQRKVPRVPRPVGQITYALWGRGGVHPDVQRAGGIGFDVEDMVRE